MSASTQSPSSVVEEPHEPHWLSRTAFPVVTLLLLTGQVLLGFALFHGAWWAAVVLVPVISHLMHGQLIAFHEASHGLLRSKRWLNDLDGFLIGVFSFTSFTLYRAAHQTHHMHLATEKDVELWPFVCTSEPRWFRVLAAFLELTLGIFFTPYLFFRTFLRKDSPIRSPRVRKQIWLELGVAGLIWAAVLAVVGTFGLWTYFVWMFVVPAFIAANLQAWRKYIEHVGMTGNTPNSATRSIVCKTLPGKILSFTLLHEPYHGVHHERSGLPHPLLPQYESLLEPKVPGDVPPFPSYRHALMHLLGSLKDPRVGSQWQGIP